MKILHANGANIPALGFGTWTLNGDQCSELVEQAIAAGYRHVDTAAMYGNEREVGAAIARSGVAREDIFLTSKIWPDDAADGDLQRSVEASLVRLNTSCLDLALIHWPPKSVPMAEVIGALNDVRSRGLAKHIGLSNYTSGMVDEAVSISQYPLACNQIENHPWLDQTGMRAACARHGLALIAYCPLARAGRLSGEKAVLDAAANHRKTPAQVVLRWHVQFDNAGAIPKTATISRLKENLQIFDFELSDGEMQAISALGRANHRICDFDFSPDWD